MAASLEGDILFNNQINIISRYVQSGTYIIYTSLVQYILDELSIRSEFRHNDTILRHSPFILVNNFHMHILLLTQADFPRPTSQN